MHRENYKVNVEDICAYPIKLLSFCRYVCKFSINSGCIKKIPLNPPLQKGEGSECPYLLRCYICFGYLRENMVTQVQGFTVQRFRVLSDKETRICEELRAKETDSRCFWVINAYCRMFPFRIEYIIHPILTIRQVTNHEL